MARPQPQDPPQAQGQIPAPRQRRRASTGPGPALWLVPIGLLLAGAVVAGSRLLVQPAQAPQTAPPPPPDTLPAEAEADPFAGVAKSVGNLPRRTSGPSGRSGGAFASARRLLDDPVWRGSVDDAERAFGLLEQAGRLQSSGGDWRTPAREAQDLLRRALDVSEPIEQRLAEDPGRSALADQLAAEREVWRRREYDLHKLIRG